MQILSEAFETVDQHSLGAVGAQAGVHLVEDAVGGARGDEVDDSLGEAREELRIVYHLGAAGTLVLAVAAVDEHQV